MNLLTVWFFLTQACCSLYWCSWFLHHRTWSKHCMVPRDPTLHELAAGPSPYLHTSHVCSTACEQTQTHVYILINATTACNYCSPEDKYGRFCVWLYCRISPQLEVVFISEFLVLCLDLKLYFKRNPNSAIVYPHGRHPTPPAVQREMGEKGSHMDADRNGESGIYFTFLNVLQIKSQLCSPSVLDWLNKQMVMKREMHMKVWKWA